MPIYSLLLLLPWLLSASGTLDHVVLSGSDTDGGGGSGSGAGLCADGSIHDDNNNRECVDGGGDTAAMNDVDANLELLLQNGIRALMEGKNYQTANSIFESIAREHPEWDQMHVVHKYNGLALSRLGDGSKALWCFTNALMLANEYPRKQNLQRDGGDGYDVFVGETRQLVQMVALEFFNKVSDMIGNKVIPDAGLMYSSAKLAHTVGKEKEAKILNDLLLKMDPNHGGGRLLAASMASEEDPMEHRDIVQNFDLLPWDAAMAWATIGALECRADPTSRQGADAWLESFRHATSMSPIYKGIATTAVVSAANTMLKGGTPVEEVRELGERAVRLGVLNAPLQLPGHLARGVSFSPFRDDARAWKAVRHLEEHFPKIREEVLSAYDSGGIARESILDGDGLQTAGEWRELNIMTSGVANPKAWKLLPYTFRAVVALADGNSMVMGGSKVSLMEPGTVVRPHTGSTNARLRIHLGVTVPDGVFMRVDNETRTWTEGRCVVIDDSYVHEVWHHGDEKRIVLIVDVWHPELDSARREDALPSHQHPLELYRSHLKDPKMALVRQDVPKALIPDQFIFDHHG